jgi:hypothetical protein
MGRDDSQVARIAVKDKFDGATGLTPDEADVVAQKAAHGQAGQCGIAAMSAFVQQSDAFYRFCFYRAAERDPVIDYDQLLVVGGSSRVFAIETQVDAVRVFSSLRKLKGKPPSVFLRTNSSSLCRSQPMMKIP